MTSVSPKKAYTFHIDQELLAGLKALKAKSGAAESESIRRAIAAYLKEQSVIVKPTESRRRRTRRDS